MVTKKQPKQSKSHTELGRHPEKAEKKPQKIKKNTEKPVKQVNDNKSKSWVSSSNKKNRHGKTKKELTKSKSCNDCTGTEEAHVH